MSELQASPSKVVNTAKGTEPGQTVYDYSHNQPWVSTKGNLSFVDETRDITTIYETETDVDTFVKPLPRRASRDPATFADDPGQTPLTWESRSPGTCTVSEVQSQLFESPVQHSPVKRRRLTVGESSVDTPAAHSVQNEVVVTELSPSNSRPGDVEGEICSIPASYILTNPSPGSAFGVPCSTEDTGPILHGTPLSTGHNALTPSHAYLDTRVWHVRSFDEAKLMRHFVENLAASFDLTDPYCHFRNVVPQRVAECPPLLNAMLAAAARHLSRISNLDVYIADRYHNECLKHLIPMLDDDAAVLDENLLASTVILRYLEEIDVPLSGQLVADSHLIGTQLFISAQERSAVTGGLRLAAFWVGLRQEIYVAFVNQRSIIPPLEHCNVDRSFEPADDGTWANRIVVHCAEVIRYCFGEESEQSLQRYAQLYEYCEDWLRFTPQSYRPIFFSDKDRIFPEVMFLSDATVTGMQHYYLARILLSSHDPSIPKLGPRRVAALRAMDSDIKEHVRMLCGLARSNSKSPPNFVTASMAVAMAGDKFSTREEQEACISILEVCETEHGWPTTTAQNNLKEAWGWVE
ncbi:hypothetical protein MBLNU459_g6035t1 [Dothideomycetes sp. NU459]